MARPDAFEIRLYRGGDANIYEDISGAVLIEGFELSAYIDRETCTLRIMEPPVEPPPWRSPVPAIGDRIAVRQRNTNAMGEWSSQLFRGTVTSVSALEFGAWLWRVVWSVRAVELRTASPVQGDYPTARENVTVTSGLPYSMEPREVAVFNVVGGGGGGGASKIRLKVREAPNEHKIEDESARRKIRTEEL